MTQAAVEGGRNSIVTIEERGRRHEFGAAELPVTLGASHDADVALDVIGTDARVGESPDRGTGFYRVPSLRSVGDRRVLWGVIELLNEARRGRGRYQRVADRVTSIFIPAVMVLAVAAGLYVGVAVFPWLTLTPLLNLGL